MVTISACSGSNEIIGTWQAQVADGTELIIEIDKKQIAVDGETSDYVHNGFGFENNMSYYTIEVNEWNIYTIIFPAKDKSIAVLIQPTDFDEPLVGTLIFVMNKNEQPNYLEYGNKYLK
ncbi:glycosyltransferase [Streptococcus suis]|uniref:Glycosyltransferase n=1 Tax=Streptococcus suis TaxID=1307 RepID=A0A116LZU9_STRSU|nr:hypothetical protein [Streptococcus suis]MCK3907520.1 glycosyltransferase [Streptococcus suis]NQH28510.1 glycosyltransferase [Streptococcus suis]NQH49123.1 glycosyltransferase [Streptococcus suis]NQH64966.1 glycosyltransferase [Streptococcus suis]NQJ59987.1 glycosyltransferase [Streptococcus suis]